jgi:IS5 family transposase
MFGKYGRKSRRELFLDEMEKVVPWSGLEALVRPHYAKAGNGRQPVGLSIMLRTYFVQQWFNLSDPGVEELLYESPVVRRFVGVDLGIASAPDETTVLRFRHLLEKHDLGGMMLDAVNVHLEAKGIKIQTGTIVDATIIHAPSSTKNSTGERDPEMRQTRKGNQWCVSRTRAQARDAVLKMGDGLPEPAYRSRLQTARCCCVQKAWW